MKKILFGFVAALGLLIVILLLVSFFLPSTYYVERTVTVNAEPADIYPYVMDLKKWPDWTVWTKEMDPTMTATYEGPEKAVGATYKWNGEKMGDGQLTITKLEPNQGVWWDLSFEQGKYQSDGAMLFEPKNGSTVVVMSDTGDLGMNPVARYFGLVMDSMIGPDFEKGLTNLKALAEANRGKFTAPVAEPDSVAVDSTAAASESQQQ